MTNFFFLTWFVIIHLFFTSIAFSGEFNYHEKGKVLFDKKKFDKSKFLFEKDIVFNPKSEKSYLYLAKIFNKEGNDDLEENNLNTVVLLNPKNEEAIYLLAALNIKRSDFFKAKELIGTLEIVCEKLCSSKKGLLKELESLSKKQ